MDKFGNYRKAVIEFTENVPCPRVLGKFRVTGEDGKAVVFATYDETIGFPGVYDIETLNEASPTAAGLVWSETVKRLEEAAYTGWELDLFHESRMRSFPKFQRLLKFCFENADVEHDRIAWMLLELVSIADVEVIE